MSVFLHCFRRPLRRHIHMDESAGTSRSCKHKSLPQAKGVSHGEDADLARIRSFQSPLPELTDFGTPPDHVREYEDIFWNSAMDEGDNEPELDKVARKKPSGDIRPKVLVNATTSRSTRYADVARANSIQEGFDTDFSHSLYHDGATKQSRRRSQDDPIARDAESAFIPTSTYGHGTIPPKSAPLPLVMMHGTPEYADFLNSASEKGINFNTNVDCYRSRITSNHIYPDTSAVIAPKSHVYGPEKLSSPYSTHEFPSSTSFGARFDCQTNRNTIISSSKDNGLTWNRAFNQILENEHLDPVIKKAVYKRIQDSHAIDGAKDDHSISFSAAAAGFVPNFSYPIAGSAFCDRRTAEHEYLDSPSSEIEIEISKGKGKLEEKLTNGVSLDEFDSRHLESLDPNQEYRAPDSPDELPDAILSLLYSLLTPSELSLHNRIVNFSSTHHAALQGGADTSSILPTPSRHESIIFKLHSIILSLQDRIIGLEETLVPQLSSWLEQKSDMIDVLNLELSGLTMEITGLKGAVDFGNKILNGCWTREGEMWRTLTVMQSKRRGKIGGLRRWTRRSDAVGEMGKENVGTGADVQSTPKGNNIPTAFGPTVSTKTIDQQQHYQQPCSNMYPPAPGSSSTSNNMSAKPLSKSELDALLTMATQNIRILQEDMHEMISLVEECVQRGRMVGDGGRVVVEEGSWRDV